MVSIDPYAGGQGWTRFHMLRPRSASRGAVAFSLAVVLTAGCTYEREGPPELHFKEFKSAAPEGNTVTVCHAYGCQKQTPFTFRQADLDRIAEIMDGARAAETPVAERRGLARATAWIERRVGAEIGTASDRASIDVLGSNDATQQDCVDEATNTTSYLMVMARNGLLRHHTVERPFAKGNLLMGVWPHWGAVIRENLSGERYVVDSSNGPNGATAEVQTAERWYMDSAASPTVPAARGTFVAADEVRSLSTAEPDSEGLRRMVDGLLGSRAGHLTTGSVR